MTKLVQWTDEERQVEADLGVQEVRKRIAALDWADRYEPVVTFCQPTLLTAEQARIWAQLASALPAPASGMFGEQILVDGPQIVRKRSEDELAKLVCATEVARREALVLAQPHTHGEGGGSHVGWKGHDGHPVHRHNPNDGRTQYRDAVSAAVDTPRTDPATGRIVSEGAGEDL